jgi:hypothetical protein
MLEQSVLGGQADPACMPQWPSHDLPPDMAPGEACSAILAAFSCVGSCKLGDLILVHGTRTATRRSVVAPDGCLRKPQKAMPSESQSITKLELPILLERVWLVSV